MFATLFHRSSQALCALSLLCIATAAAAQQPDADETSKIKDRFTVLAEGLEIRSSDGANHKFELQSPPALSWSNPARQTAAGAMFLWTLNDRPQVALSLYPSSETIIDLEFQSLSESSLTAQSKTQVLWQPNEAGIQWLAVDGAAAPAKTPFQRLRQMRTLARQFTARLVPPNKNPMPLRLLDTPVHRSDFSKSQIDVQQPLIDAAVFTFVQGTDPEVILLIEAFAEDDQQKWRYAVARTTIVPLEVYRHEKLVWTTGSQWAVHRIDTPYHVYKSFNEETQK
ncbi:hypothetical protein NHH03_11885 [Stieleria sp. TO1_6]|uniref:hypothetical protein n=1 Tax=Stieleria tagensis TaxID=2956795 RepID=UPI00209A9455|nr:hypothetical protein [Stieleria tagensis]MCO8122438.1 hypothetical protein [Stieleria tagensis]